MSDEVCPECRLSDGHQEWCSYAERKREVLASPPGGGGYYPTADIKWLVDGNGNRMLCQRWSSDIRANEPEWVAVREQHI